jgi:hypothetical protein
MPNNNPMTPTPRRPQVTRKMDKNRARFLLEKSYKKWPCKYCQRGSVHLLPTNAKECLFCRKSVRSRIEQVVKVDNLSRGVPSWYVTPRPNYRVCLRIPYNAGAGWKKFLYKHDAEAWARKMKRRLAGTK